MKHKHRGSGKLNYKHDMISGLREFLEKLEGVEAIQSIIPAKIKRTKTVSPHFFFKASRKTKSGLKCLAYSKNTVQVVHVTTNNIPLVEKQIIKTMISHSRPGLVRRDTVRRDEVR